MGLFALLMVGLTVALVAGGCVATGTTCSALIESRILFDIVLLVAVVLFLAALAGAEAVWG